MRADRVGSADSPAEVQRGLQGMARTLGSQRQAAVTAKRGYYRVPRKNPANRVEGALAEAVRAKFAEGWPKARIAREFRLNRRTVIRICAQRLSKPEPRRPATLTPAQAGPTVGKFVRPGFVRPRPSFIQFSPRPSSIQLIRCIGCGMHFPKGSLQTHWPLCSAVREGRLSLKDCPA